ncbi:MAG: PQQ-dependent sugar dehydrogenase [Ferruginibacter sp.]|nr:PQQ-dependent sugar dehydrogenase [Cytophagales bacterium]
MKKSVSYLAIPVLAGLLWAGRPPKPAKYELREAYPGLAFDQPVEFVNPDDGTNRVFVIAQKGVIHTFPQKGATTAKVFLDLTNGVVSGGERGLLGLAFHPNFKQNGYFYVNYTRGKPLETVIARFQVSKTDPNRADPASQLILLTYAQPFDNHNGGKVAFGKDGYLYISAGDGGSGGDPHSNGQNLKALLGKIMRIDVDKKEGKLNYGIPKDNPFKGNKEGNRQEIYAYGLRNVWKFSFDAQNGQLWAGDVGQNEREEIDTIVNGGNYGWKIMEGKECFKSKECSRDNLKQPVIEYLHSTGDGQSVTGGFVYRGKQMPTLAGSYVYGDYLSGKVWALKKQPSGQVSNELILDYDGLISSFGEDKDKELYICSYSDGKILKLAGAGSQ